MTTKSKTPHIRYNEGCLAAHALNLIGDRWALLVVRELMFAPKRFQMIRSGLPGVSAGVLTSRLQQLREVGVIAHDKRMAVYSLTDAGQRLLPVLEALCDWALTVPDHDPSRFISPSALMISMGVTLIREKVNRLTVSAGFDFGAEAFAIQLIDGHLATAAVVQPDTPFVLSGNGNALAVAVYGKAPLSLLVAQNSIGVEGDIAAAQNFVELFQLQTTLSKPASPGMADRKFGS